MTNYLKDLKSRHPAMMDFIVQKFKEEIEEEILEELDVKSLIPGQYNFLSFFVVLKEDSSSTPARIVMDAAAKMHGVSLNDYIEAGPNLICLVPPALTYFRQGKVAYCLDIKAMFLQTWLPEEDRNYHGLWVPMEDGCLKAYRSTRSVFGNRGSPCGALIA